MTSSATGTNVFPSAERSLAMLRRMILIRKAEEQLGADSHAGNLPGNVHLSVGQEAIAVGVCDHLGDDDFAASTHRGHGHFLAKGGSVNGLLAEVHGKVTGACRGMGGSMHVTDLNRGMLGANGIVGGGIGLAAGAALSCQREGKGHVSVGFFGDGASSQGILAEVLNIASLWQLPLLLICENNGYSEFSPSNTVTAGNISDRARAFAVETEELDGNDLGAVWAAAGRAVARARDGGGPTFIEARTYRTRGHLEAEAGFLTRPYRSEDEIEKWRKEDPIGRFKAHLEDSGVLTDDAYGKLEADVQDEVAAALTLALESEAPDMAVFDSSVFVDQEY